MKKKLATMILLPVFCASLLMGCTTQPEGTIPPDCAEPTAPGSQIQPREDQIPAHPGEGPNGLPTPTV